MSRSVPTQIKQKRQTREGRLVIVAQLYKRGYSIRQIRAEVMKRLGLTSYSTQTVHNDVKILLNEWKENRISDIDDAIQLELERIDETCRELWQQWEKSKEDYVQTRSTRKGSPSKNKETGEREVQTYSVEEHQRSIIALGNPAYIAEIRQQLAERRKLLGLYAPEKRDISGRLETAVDITNMSETEIQAEIQRITDSLGRH